MVERREVAAQPAEERCGTPSTGRTLTKRTSGTTGQYLTVESSAHAAWWQGVLALRRNRIRGVQPWHRTAAIRVDPDGRARHGVLGSLTRRSAVLDAGKDPAALAASLMRLEPVAVSGFGHLLLDVGRHLRGLRPRVVGTGGQVLAPNDREAIAEVFGVAPLDLYGSVEVGSIAWQCLAGDLYHVDHDSVLVEILDRDGIPMPFGEPGEVVVTTLRSPHMPFIRYRLGDQATLAARPCRCGFVGPAIEEIAGRAMDRFVGDDGVAVASSRLFLTAQLGEVLPWVARYRVLQDEHGAVTVEIVPVGSLPPDATTRIIEGYRSVLGDSASVTVVAVPAIPLEPSGKLRQFVSAAHPARS